MKISVLISVYSEADPKQLDRALLSVWDDQTVRPDQIVLVKDGPIGEAIESVVEHWSYKLRDHMSSVGLEVNCGLAIALNEGLKACRNELIARMDADDVSMPHRFEKQIEYMEKNPDIVASSAVVEEWDANLVKVFGVRRLPLDHCELMSFSKYRSPLSHPVSMFRKSHVVALGGYPNLRKGQDFALWSLLIVSGYKLGNLSDSLLKMRAGDALLERRGLAFFMKEYELLRYQRSIGFLSRFEYVRNLLLRGLLRVLPLSIKKIAYKRIR